MKIVQLTTDNRNQFGDHVLAEPYFGTAPTGLLDGFAELPDVEVHVISCASTRMRIPEKLGDNIWFHQPYMMKAGWGRSLFLGCVWSVRRVLDRLQPDIVHGQGTERDCAMAAVLSGYPNVLTIHGNMRVHAKRPEHRGSNYYKMAAALETFCLKRTGGVVAISSYTRDLVEDIARKAWLLPNAVDKRFFAVNAEPPPVPRILFVGSLDERKNPLGLLQACEEMLRRGECTLALAGQSPNNSPYVKKLMEAVKALPGVSLLGFLDREQLAVEFANCSLLVLPTFEDNCPMVVLEAMAAGLAVAASRVGGVPDLVNHETDGLMFDPHDPLDVRRTVERLVKDRDFRETLGAAGRKKALESFHPRIIAQRHVEIYREVLGR
ncbi:MAG TPA: glycosyltransferase family 4 protein [Luteolibacter sp.]